MAHILAIRFSALGDIAMAVPVIYSFARRYPMHQVTVLSRQHVAPLFASAPENVHFKGVDLNNYKGVVGLTRLYKELQLMHFDAVADLHDVLRTKYLRLAFHADRIPTAHIHKEHHERRTLTRQHNKKKEQLRTSPERYSLVFSELGYPFDMDFKSLFGDSKPRLPETVVQKVGAHNEKWIGIAPFAKHEGKIYPLDKMEQVMAILDQQPGCHIWLFGAGSKEKAWTKACAEKYNNVTSLVGCFSLDKELKLMAHLDVMVSMDSANMHLASLTNTPVVSIWGATHPFAGFAGLQPKGSVIVQKEMACRPCSIFGEKPCARGDLKCMASIAPQLVATAVLKVCKMEMQAQKDGMTGHKIYESKNE